MGRACILEKVFPLQKRAGQNFLNRLYETVNKVVIVGAGDALVAPA